MAKFYGMLGYVETTEVRPSVFVEEAAERPCVGDIVRNYRRVENGLGINDDINLSNQLSIVADPYAMDHYFAIRYVKWNGGCWKVTGVEIQWPRLLLTIGGLYNGNGETP